MEGAAPVREPVTTLPPPIRSDACPVIASFGAAQNFVPMSTPTQPYSSPTAAVPPSPPTLDFSPRARLAPQSAGHMTDSDREPARRLRQEGAASSAQEPTQMQDEWYHTLMSRLRRLGEVTAPQRTVERSAEPVTSTPREPRAAVRTSSRDALHAKLRELGMDRPELPTFRQLDVATPPGSFNAQEARLLDELPDRAVRRDGRAAFHTWRRPEELIF